MAATDPRYVGLVIVSHSAKVAEGTVELAVQMAGPEVRLVAAGGLEDGTIGTDAVRIADGVRAADTGAGVVILADLGSAVLSARTALDLLEPEMAERVRMSKGPLVEGAVIAAVQASTGSTLEEVVEAADAAAMLPKG